MMLFTDEEKEGVSLWGKHSSELQYSDFPCWVTPLVGFADVKVCRS